MTLSFTPPTQEAINHIAAHMRQADVVEVWASSHHTPLQSLMKGQELSDLSTIITVDDTPVVMLGLVKRDILSGSGVVWMLATDDLVRHRVALSRTTEGVIDEMLHVCPRLCNMVHDKNKVSIAWLKRLGFTLDDPVPHGPEGEMFHRFHLER